ncbi:uncharacterized protein LOC143230428 [Tachypleus tridentatus]|uniref:uncharacterized protein LOC143230428 n=1 Tax=Tachypleus tridentatus TaxID=6853 RepID=UPI003FD3239E
MLDVNKISIVESGAFEGSEKTARTISLYGNQLKDFPFGDIQKFPGLLTFNLGLNKLTSVPDSAFGPHPNLRTIILAENEITSIGRGAFSGLPKLSTIELSSNKISTLGPQSLAMTGHSVGLAVLLSSNMIADIATDAFRGITPAYLALNKNSLEFLDKDVFLPLMQDMSKVENAQISFKGNPFSCSGCNNYQWLVENKEIVMKLLTDFLCEDGKTLEDLETTDIGCPVLL